MNYEELLETRDARKTTKVRLPYGYFYKRLIEGKYSNFVEFHDEVADALGFSSSVRAEHQALVDIKSKHQLRYTPNEGEGGIYAIAVEVGNYVTMEQLLNENPSKVAQGNYVNATLHDLFELTQELNDHQIYHLCFAPSNILTRKNDGSVFLLCHGSFYKRVDQDMLYDGVEDFVAPEVFRGDAVDARSDVYSLGKFISWFYESSGLPFELKHIVEKATSESPNERYDSVEALRQAINTARSVRHTGILAVSALAIALIVVGLFFYMLPSPEDIEYVKAVDEPIPDEMLEEDMDEFLGLGADLDSATIAEIVAGEQQRRDSTSSETNMRLYNAKAEAIFRKQFSKAADAIISKVYTPSTMNGEVNAFQAKSKTMTEELARKQEELAKLTNLGSDRTQAIASEIIENITKKKMEAMDKDYMGLRPKQEEQDASSIKTPSVPDPSQKNNK